jgi:hypothetical protein
VPFASAISFLTQKSNGYEKASSFFRPLPSAPAGLQKRQQWDDNNSPAGTRLVKETVANGSSTETATYSYTAEGKLSSVRWNYGGLGYEDMRISRNADGLIEKLTYTNPNPRDIRVINVGSSGGKYTFTEWTTIEGLDTFVQKISFAYDLEGRIAETIETEQFRGRNPDAKSRKTYAYTNNNLATVKVYRIAGGNNNLADTYQFTYDDKINPVAFGPEWILLSLDDGNYDTRSSANNCTKIIVMEDNFPPETYNYTYTYTNQNRPATFTYKSSNSSQPAATGTYTYE